MPVLVFPVIVQGSLGNCTTWNGTVINRNMDMYLCGFFCWNIMGLNFCSTTISRTFKSATNKYFMDDSAINFSTMFSKMYPGTPSVENFFKKVDFSL